ncbi:serine/arginine-rich SC35-like splicing factor SCL30A [Myzus persicae]|uniref:serine/arginine-rich SC35-like splicing factor SCL30A n=1 Tax=Myzus persicae TaxID=13164 RepID=UPI000B937280|nr:serine/arginine-rich SC35-like splicing factor SCL30A [Myzus persicae]XP_022164960.1 serine/arginine-rich SC35-like splicing factor SCL30A [Myzus persicae]XP_022164961.1 serine/arginine-rich SC35-like splicing factor SCL30A [Myzus persicae]
MAPSKSINRNSNSKNSRFNSRSKSSSNILKVNEKKKYLKLINAKEKTSKKWYDVTVQNPKRGRTTLKKSSSSIPIKCKIQCPQTSCCIRITNLSRKVSKHFLHQIFSEFGTIKKLDLHFNTYDRISKGFSYIMFSTPEESENAVITMDRCEIDGYDIMCELWFLPYIENRVSSILRGASSGVRYQRNSSKCISSTCNIQHYSQLDGLSSHSGTLSHSQTSYDYLPPNKSISGSSRKSSRLRSGSKSLPTHHSKSQRKSNNRSRSNSRNRSRSNSRNIIIDSKRSKSSHSRFSKRSHYRYSRKQY